MFDCKGQEPEKKTVPSDRRARAVMRHEFHINAASACRLRKRKYFFSKNKNIFCFSILTYLECFFYQVYILRMQWRVN